MCSRFTIFLISLLSFVEISADTLETQNGLTIYYSIVPTLMLSKNVAKQYQIVRAKDRSILNIAMRLDFQRPLQSKEHLAFPPLDVCQHLLEKDYQYEGLYYDI